MIYYQETSGRIMTFPSDPASNFIPAGAVLITEAEFLAASMPPPLQQAQTYQINGNPFSATQYSLAVAYAAATSAPVSFTSAGGVTKTYQADTASIANLQHSITGCQATTPSAPVTPTGFYWVAADNTQVPFAYADLLGLAAAIFAQGAAAFAHFQTKKAEVMAATTVAAVQSITW
jgi:hypothetical protein